MSSSTSKEDDSSDDSTHNPNDNFGEMKDSETMIQIAPSRLDISSDTSTDSDGSHGDQTTVTEVSGAYKPLYDENLTPKHGTSHHGILL